MCNVLSELCEDADELDGLRRNVLPMLAVSREVVDLEGCRSVKYSSGLGVRSMWLLVGVLVLESVGEIGRIGMVIMLLDVFDR